MEVENAIQDGPAPDRAAALGSGDSVGGYVLEARLGRGGFGEVWLARRAEQGPGRAEPGSGRVAIKLPRHPELLELLRDAPASDPGFEHHGVLRVLDLDLDSRPPYVVEEFAEGGDLARMLARDGPLPLDEAMTIFHDVVRVVAAAHARGVVHRDLRPANIFLDADGHVRVADFGLVRSLREKLDRTDRRRPRTRRSLAALPLRGVWDYMSPEARDWALRKRRASPPDARADVYALGILLYELLRGRRPEGRVDLRGISSGIDRIFARSWTAIDRRYRDAGELLRDLELLRSRAENHRESSRSPRRARGARSGAGAYRGSTIIWQRALWLTPILLIGALVYFFWVRGDAPWRRSLRRRDGEVRAPSDPVLSEDAKRLAAIRGEIVSDPADVRSALALLSEFIVVAREDPLREKALAWRDALSSSAEPRQTTVTLRRVAIDRESYRRRDDARVEPGYPDIFVRVLQTREGVEREVFSTREEPIEAWAHDWSPDAPSSRFRIDWREGDGLRVEILDADLIKDDKLGEVRVDEGYSILLLSRASRSDEGHEVVFESNFPFGR